MKSKTLGVALLVATFVAGGLAGAASLRVLNAAEPVPARETDCRDRDGKHAWLEQLNLSSEQRARIDQVMKRRHAQTKAFWDDEGARLRTIVDSTRNEIRALLTPQQRAEYDRLRAERKAAREARKKADKQSRASE